MRRAAAGLLVVALAAGASGCGSKSPEDVATANGEKVGKAAKELTSATSVSDIENGLTDLQAALDDVKSNVKDKGGELQREVNQTKSSLTDAVDQVKQAVKSGNLGNVSDAIGAAQAAVSHVGEDATSLAASSDKVVKSFWSGVKKGYGG
jgi:formiminotetrahydrofolate cyclodeaminase